MILAPAPVGLLSRWRVPLAQASNLSKLWDLGGDTQAISNSPQQSKKEAPQKHTLSISTGPTAVKGSGLPGQMWVEGRVGGCAEEGPRAEEGFESPLGQPSCPSSLPGRGCCWRCLTSLWTRGPRQLSCELHSVQLASGAG